MNRIAKLFRTTVVAASALAFAAGSAATGPLAVQPRVQQLVTPVQADCYAIGQRVAAEMGGRLASVSSSGGNCIVLVLIPAQNGQPPRRERVVVPAN